MDILKQRYIKNLYDSYPELHIVFTSSSLPVIDHSIADLSRRASMYTLPGLSFREFLVFEGEQPLERLTLTDILYSHETIAPSIASKSDVLTRFGKYMAKGYYPFYTSMGTDDYYSRLEQTITTVVDSDIPAVEHRIDYETLIKAKRLIGIITCSQPYRPNLSTLAGLMGTNRNQLIKLLDLLDRAGIGGKGKGFAQIRDIPDSFVVADEIEFGFGKKITLWLFGFLY